MRHRVLRPLIIGLALVAGLAVAGCGNKEEVRLHAETEGPYIDFGPVKYQVQMSRELNAADAEDRYYVKGLPEGTSRLSPEQVWFGVWMRAENESDGPVPAVRDFEITDAQEVDAAYNPSVSGLNLNFNRVHVKWDARRGKERLSVEAAAVRLSPVVEIVRVALAPGPGAPLFAFREEDGNEHWQMAREAYRGQAARWLPVKRPEVYAGEVFRKLAGDQGMSLGRPRPGRAPAGAEVLAVHRSRPLAEILREMLRHSTNLTAEVTGAAAARAVGAEARSLAGSAAVLNAWAGTVSGFPGDDAEFRLVNHSGLTLESRVSPRRMVALLAALGRRSPGAGAHAELPGGIAGYLRPHDVSAEGVPIDWRRLEVVAKTGTMSYVRGLAGYVATPGGRRLAFAIFSNDLERRGDGPERVDKAWMGRAKGFERALIRSWVLRVDSGA